MYSSGCQNIKKRIITNCEKKEKNLRWHINKTIVKMSKTKNTKSMSLFGIWLFFGQCFKEITSISKNLTISHYIWELKA